MVSGKVAEWQSGKEESLCGSAPLREPPPRGALKLDEVLDGPAPGVMLANLAERLRPAGTVALTHAVVMARYGAAFTLAEVEGEPDVSSLEPEALPDQVVGVYTVFQLVDAVKRLLEIERSPEIRRRCLRLPEELERCELVLVYDRVVEVRL